MKYDSRILAVLALLLLFVSGCAAELNAVQPRQADKVGTIEGAALVAGSDDHSDTTVRFVANGSGVAGQPVQVSTLTSSDGMFRLSSIPYGEYSLVFERSGFPPVSSPGFKLDQPLLTLAPAYLVREPSGITTIAGTIRLVGLSDSPGGQVTATAWGYSGNAVTAPDGSFALTAIPSGFYYRIGFGAPGYSAVELQALVEDGEYLELPDVWLYENGSISGQVIMADGRPPASAVAVLSDGRGGNWKVATDVGGWYQFDDVAPDRYWLGAVLAESTRTAHDGSPCVDVVVVPGEETGVPTILVGEDECREAAH